MAQVCKLILILYMGWWLQLPAYAADFVQPRSWDFIHARGGLQVEQPTRKGGQSVLPISCNVSGIKTISTTPKIRHSQLAWAESVVKVEGVSIYLTIYTARQSPKYPSAHCGAAAIKRLEPGDYELIYLNPDGSSRRLTVVNVHSC